MQEVNFKVEILTPLMLAGANQQEPELRVPSFRGMLRYWQRALLGGLYGTDASGLAQVAEHEAATFGSVAQGSAVTLQLQEETPLNAKSVQDWHKKTRRPALLQGQQFHLKLKTRLPGQADKLTKAIGALWLLASLGGVGTRARRGLGNLALTPLDWTGTLKFQPPTSPEALSAFLEQGLSDISQPYHRDYLRSADPARFDALLPDACRIWVLSATTTWPTAKSAFDRLDQAREVLSWPHPPPGQRLACPLTLRVVRLGQNRYTGVAILFQATTYGSIAAWVGKEFPGCQEVKW